VGLAPFFSFLSSCSAMEAIPFAYRFAYRGAR
jgi:hypothetical protein